VEGQEEYPKESLGNNKLERELEQMKRKRAKTMIGVNLVSFSS
jgi:hypothetical protein